MCLGFVNEELRCCSSNYIVIDAQGNEIFRIYDVGSFRNAAEKLRLGLGLKTKEKKVSDETCFSPLTKTSTSTNTNASAAATATTAITSSASERRVAATLSSSHSNGGRNDENNHKNPEIPNNNNHEAEVNGCSGDSSSQLRPRAHNAAISPGEGTSPSLPPPPEETIASSSSAKGTFTLSPCTSNNPLDNTKLKSTRDNTNTKDYIGSSSSSSGESTSRSSAFVNKAKEEEATPTTASLMNPKKIIGDGSGDKRNGANTTTIDTDLSESGNNGCVGDIGSANECLRETKWKVEEKVKDEDDDDDNVGVHEDSSCSSSGAKRYDYGQGDVQVRNPGLIMNEGPPSSSSSCALGGFIRCLDSCVSLISGGMEFHVYSCELGVVIGTVKKQWEELYDHYFNLVDCVGVNFPKDLSVRHKALILGALFLLVRRFHIKQFQGRKGYLFTNLIC
jgi:hypothetical protein